MFARARARFVRAPACPRKLTVFCDRLSRCVATWERGSRGKGLPFPLDKYIYLFISSCVHISVDIFKKRCAFLVGFFCFFAVR